MQVGTDMADATLDNALSQSSLFGLSLKQAQSALREVISVVDKWRDHFLAVGMTHRDIEVVAEHLERPYLAQQRRVWLKTI